MSGPTRGQLKRPLGLYARLLSTPGSAPLTALGLAGRAAYLSMPYCLLLLGLAWYGSVSRGATLTGCFCLATAVGMPLGTRLCRRHGARLALATTTVCATTAGVGVTVSGTHAGPFALTAGFVVAAGLTFPPIGPVVRARWALVLSDDESRAAARAMEAVLTEVLIVIGPALVSLTTSWRGAGAAFDALIGMCAVGGLGVAVLAGMPAPAGGRVAPRPPADSRMWTGTFAVLLTAIGCGAAGLACVEVGLPALFLHRGDPATRSGLVLSCLAAGSIAGGLWYGARAWNATMRARYGLACGLLAGGVAALLGATVYAPFPVVLGTALVCGLPLSATTTEEFGLLERTAPAERLTEGIAYLLSVNSLGAALGALAAARLLPTRGGAAVLWLGAAALALSAAIVTAFLGAAARPAEG